MAGQAVVQAGSKNDLTLVDPGQRHIAFVEAKIIPFLSKLNYSLTGKIQATVDLPLVSAKTLLDERTVAIQKESGLGAWTLDVLIWLLSNESRLFPLLIDCQHARKRFESGTRYSSPQDIHDYVTFFVEKLTDDKNLKINYITHQMDQTEFNYTEELYSIYKCPHTSSAKPRIYNIFVGVSVVRFVRHRDIMAEFLGSFLLCPDQLKSIKDPGFMDVPLDDPDLSLQEIIDPAKKGFFYLFGNVHFFLFNRICIAFQTLFEGRHLLQLLFSRREEYIAQFKKAKYNKFIIDPAPSKLLCDIEAFYSNPFLQTLFMFIQHNQTTTLPEFSAECINRRDEFAKTFTKPFKALNDKLVDCQSLFSLLWPKKIEKNEKILGYHVQEPLGAGGMGNVWKVQDAQSCFAMKEVLNQDLETKIDWYQREVDAHYTATRQPRPPRVPDFIQKILQPGCTPRFVAEFVPGMTSDKFFLQNPLTAPKAMKVLLLTLETLDAIHDKGVIHRDLKPLNIMIHQDTEEPWIVDFGIAKDLQLAAAGGTLTDIGTACFRAPESSFKVDKFTDIFSLGATLLAWVNPAPAESQWCDVVPNCSLFNNHFKNFLSKMVAPDYLQRFQNCQEALVALKPLI